VFHRFRSKYIVGTVSDRDVKHAEQLVARHSLVFAAGMRSDSAVG
jgi:hypothetical protein